MHSFDNYRLLFKDVHIPFAVYREWIMVKGDFLIQTLSPTSIELKKIDFVPCLWLVFLSVKFRFIRLTKLLPNLSKPDIGPSVYGIMLYSKTPIRN